MGMRIDVEEKFSRQILPSDPETILSIPKIQRPVPCIDKPDTELSKPAIQPPDYSPLPVGDKKVGVIAQVGTFKRAADIVAVKKLIGRERVSIAAKPGNIIDLKEKFKGRAPHLSVFLQPPDYTAYASGEKKKGLISQVGLAKTTREADEEVLKKNVKIKEDKPVQNVGVLAVFDKFFNWLNKAIGE